MAAPELELLTKRRINMVRLLGAASRLANELDSEAKRRRLKIYLQVLERLCEELGEEDATDEERTEYRRKIERLGELLDNGRLLRSSGSALAACQAHANSRLSRGEANAELVTRLTAASQVQSALRARLLEHVDRSPQTDGAAAAAAIAANALATCGASKTAVAGGGCSGGGAAASASLGSTAGATDAEAAPEAAASAGEPASSAAGLRNRASTKRGACAGAAASSCDEGGYDAKSEAQALEVQRGLQEALVDDTAHMVSELKAKSLAARKAVVDDIRTLEMTEGVLESNRAQLDASNERLRQQLQHMRSSTCFVWLMMLVVCAVFIFMFLVMKAFKKKS